MLTSIKNRSAFATFAETLGSCFCLFVQTSQTDKFAQLGPLNGGQLMRQFGIGTTKNFEAKAIKHVGCNSHKQICDVSHVTSW